jgi:hypothetical protein
MIAHCTGLCIFCNMIIVFFVQVLSIRLTSGRILQNTFSREDDVSTVIDACRAEQEQHDQQTAEQLKRLQASGANLSRLRIRVRRDDSQLCLFVPTSNDFTQTVVLADPARKLGEISVLMRRVEASLTPVLISGALLHRARIGSEWECIGVARCVDRAARWLIDTPETTTFIGTMSRLLRDEQHVATRRRSSAHELHESTSTQKVVSKATSLQLSIRRAHSAGSAPQRRSSADNVPDDRWSNVYDLHRQKRNSEGQVQLDGVVREDTVALGNKSRSRRVVVNHTDVTTPLTVHVVGCVLPTELAQQRFDTLSEHIELRVTAFVRYGDVSLAETRSTSAATPVKSGTRSLVTWNEALQLDDVPIPTLPREACLDVRLCAVSTDSVTSVVM